MLTRWPDNFMEKLAIATCVLTLALSTPFVALRLYVRRFLTRQVWWDDCSFSLHIATNHHPIDKLMTSDRVLHYSLDLRNCTSWSSLQTSQLWNP